MTEELSLPNRIYMIVCFEFTDNQVANQHVKSQSFVKDNSIIRYGKIDLTLRVKATFRTFVAKAYLIDLFQQSWA